MPARSASENEARLSLAALWNIVYQGKWLVLFTTFVVAAAITGYTVSMDPVFEATSIVSVDTRQAPTVDAATFVQRRSVVGEVGLLQNSIELAERVVARLREASDALGTEAHFPILQGGGTGSPSSREIAFQILEQVRFDLYTAQEMIGISAESTVPEEAASIANYYAEEYEQYRRENSRGSIAATRAFLEEQVEMHRGALQVLEGQWAAFARDREVIKHGQQGERLADEYAAVIARREQAQAALNDEEVALQVLERQLEQVEPRLRELVLQERNVSELETDIGAIERRLSELKLEAEQFYAVDPSLRGDEARIPRLAELNQLIGSFDARKDELTQQLIKDRLDQQGSAEEGGQLAYVARLQSRVLDIEMAARELRAQIEGLDERIATYETQLQGIPSQRVAQTQLERERAQAEQAYTSLAQQLQQTMIAEMGELGYVKVVRGAFVPLVPVRPNLKQNLILGLLMGLGFGIGLAFMKQASRRLLSTPEELQAEGYDLVGIVPKMDKEIKAAFGGKEKVERDGRMLSTNLITLLKPWSPTSENFRLIQTHMRYADPSSPVKVLLVTSPEVSDGKSVTAMNLAITMAQSGHRTLMIDADMRHPTAHILLGVERDPGLAELLNGKATFDPEAYATGIDNLTFIPAGRIKFPPAEILGGAVFEMFLADMRQAYDAIIIDSPPVLAVTDAVILAPQCDAAVIVISASKTDRRSLEVTQNTLESVGSWVAGTVINRFDAGRQSKVYQNGYVYTQSYGSNEG